MTFTLAHLSDPHIGPLPKAEWHQLLGKRFTGYWNWHKKRHNIHNMDVLARIIADIRAQSPDHIALTGDVVNIGLPLEFPQARLALLGLGAPQDVSLIPGNHDAYVGNSLPAMRDVFAPYLCGDTGEGTPYLRRRGPLALIGLSSAICTPPFFADGALGKAQREKARALLRQAKAEGLIRVVMIHHPPFKEGVKFGRGLRDSASFMQILREEGAELVLHGHNHTHSHYKLQDMRGKIIPIFGVESASAVPGSAHHLAGWHLFRFEEGHISLERRGITNRDAAFAPVETIAVS